MGGFFYGVLFLCFEPVTEILSSLTFPVSHAVEKQPVGGERPVLDEAHVMAGLDARHAKERHSLACAVQGAGPRSPGDGDLHRVVRRPFPVTVDLRVDRKDEVSECVTLDLHVLRKWLPVCCRCGSTV